MTARLPLRERPPALSPPRNLAANPANPGPAVPAGATKPIPAGPPPAPNQTNPPAPPAPLPWQAPGQILVSEAAAPPPRFLQQLLDSNPYFRASWERRRPDFQEQTSRAYQASLAVLALNAGWQDQQVVDLIIAWRRRHRREFKLRSGYYQKILAAGRQPARRQQAEAELEALLTAPSGRSAAPTPMELLPLLSSLLNCRLYKLLEYPGNPPQYLLETERGRVPLGTADAWDDQKAFQERMAARLGYKPPTALETAWPRHRQALLQAAEKAPPQATAPPPANPQQPPQQSRQPAPPPDNPPQPQPQPRPRAQYTPQGYAPPHRSPGTPRPQTPAANPGRPAPANPRPPARTSTANPAADSVNALTARWLVGYLAAHQIPTDPEAWLRQAAQENPFRKNGCLHVFSRPLRAWLTAQGGPELSPHDMGQRLRRLGAMPITLPNAGPALDNGPENPGSPPGSRQTWRLPPEF